MINMSDSFRLAADGKVNVTLGVFYVIRLAPRLSFRIITYGFLRKLQIESGTIT